MKKLLSSLADQIFEYGEKHRTLESWYVAIGTFICPIIVLAVLIFKVETPGWMLIYPLYKTITLLIFFCTLPFRKKDNALFDICTISSVLSDLDVLILMKMHQSFLRRA